MGSFADRRQFIEASDDMPISIEKICEVNSSKHSSRLSKPDIEPKTPNHGVHACAGITIAFGLISRAILANSFAGIPTIGRPSPANLAPRFRNVWLNFSAASSDGKTNTVWTLRVLPPWEYMLEISQVKTNRTGLFSSVQYKPASGAECKSRLISAIPCGCVKSPVPSKCTPLNAAVLSTLRIVRSFEQARANLE